MTKSLPKYKDCEYSLFISYAFDDNDTNNNWVSSLKRAIWKYMSDLKKDLNQKRLLDIYFSEENGEAAGSLSAELKEHAEKSFAMLLVVGKNYVTSNYCETELKSFSEIFGDNGAKAHRLYIAVMSEDALIAVQEKETWKKIVTDDSKYQCFFDKNNPHTPHPAGEWNHYINVQFNDVFYSFVKKLFGPLKAEIIKDYNLPQSPNTNPPHSVVPTNESQKTNNKPLTIAVSATATINIELKKKIETLREKLMSHGANLINIDEALFADYDHTLTEKQLKQLRISKELVSVDALIVPFEEEHPPLQPCSALDGGHLGILEKVWKDLGKTQNFFWYKPTLEQGVDEQSLEQGVDEQSCISQRHIIKIASLKPVYKTVDDICSQLFGHNKTTTDDAIIIRIENNGAFDLLKNRIEGFWRDKVTKNFPLIPEIAIRPLDILNLKEIAHQKPSLGYVLVSNYLPDNSTENTTTSNKSPSTIKDIKAIEEYVEKIEDLAGRYFTGRVAFVYPQSPETQAPELPTQGPWLHIECKKINTDPPPDFELNSKQIEEFLTAVADNYTNKKKKNF